MVLNGMMMCTESPENGALYKNKHMYIYDRINTGPMGTVVGVRLAVCTGNHCHPSFKTIWLTPMS